LGWSRGQTAVASALAKSILSAEGLHPRGRVWTWIFFLILPLPAVIVLGLWFVQQALFGVYNLTDPTGGGGVAYYAHIGGFLFGLLAIRLFATRRKQV
jgi:membrane associated rhomboid family serine protease